MPLTPEANLTFVSFGAHDEVAPYFAQYVLDKLLSLDVGHTVNTGDTITVGCMSVPVRIF